MQFLTYERLHVCLASIFKLSHEFIPLYEKHFWPVSVRFLGKYRFSCECLMTLSRHWLLLVKRFCKYTGARPFRDLYTMTLVSMSIKLPCNGKYSIIKQLKAGYVHDHPNWYSLATESRKHYGRTVIDRRKACRTIEIWRKVLVKNIIWKVKFEATGRKETVNDNLNQGKFQHHCAHMPNSKIIFKFHHLR